MIAAPDFGMSSQSPEEPALHQPALVAARVVENAVELLRAEAKLVSVHARNVLIRTVGVVLTAMLATSAAQVALLLAALSPVAFASRPRSAFLVALLPSVVLCGIGVWLTLRGMRALRAGPLAQRVGE
jgi:hypothetical protein